MIVKQNEEIQFDIVVVGARFIPFETPIGEFIVSTLLLLDF